MAKKNNFSDNVARWLNIAELKIDYYTQFVKAWIPFNAWYMVSYSIALNSDKDRVIIDHIKDNSNPFRDRIINLLMDATATGLEFKHYLAQLHLELEGHTVPSHDNKLSFRSLFVKKNPNSSHTLSQGKFVYKVTYDETIPKNQNRLKCEIFDSTQNLRNIYLEDLPTWDKTLFDNHFPYQALSQTKKKYLKECFLQVNPKRTENIILDPKIQSNGKKMAPLGGVTIDREFSIYFVNNPILISQALIEMLYNLRCILFHGEINPTDTNQKIYKYAFLIQQILIQELQ
ncbi:hypothetical protein HNP38_001106 [Chryseobacterium defluvii]|uniref:Apea-like HEPN domain-containing protein n=1 Tax=Chryseobacterium defluvii TaxID=160396 RepID=A0A840KDI4_9FLAO|nr:hypothetical protein [Chryseobacterium defluvii]MBB4805834.1 hypothetical protein [Chryseobacterium defluvii]